MEEIGQLHAAAALSPGKWHPLFMVWQDGCNPVVFYHMQIAPLVFNGSGN
jgi:hypothetical protein